MLSKAFSPVDANMLKLRGSTYAAARRIVLFQRRHGEEVAIATAVVRLLESHESPTLEVPILVVAKQERKNGYGRLFVDVLSKLGEDLGCGLLVAWAAGESKPFWTRVDMHEKVAAHASAELKQAISRYGQMNSAAGFSDSKMVAKLLGRT